MTIAIPASARPLGTAKAQALYARTILANLAHRVLVRRRRHGDQVSADYDAGEWSQQKAAKRWAAAPTVEAYVDKEWQGREIVAEMDGLLWQVPAPDYYRFRRAKLIALLASLDCGARTLVELGSGTGSNLFALSTSDRWDHLLGLELSETGREVSRSVAERFGLAERIGFERIDLLDPGSEGFRRLDGAVVFTHYCLEQLPDHTETVFRNLVAAGIRRAIMIEPTYELLGTTTLKDLASLTYVLRQDYQRTIIGTAEKLRAEGLIDVVEARRLDFVSSWRNAPTLLVWDVRR